MKSGFADLMCVKLAISNEGTMVDENIDVPAAILLKDAVASIPYTIASKNLAEIIKGTLMMEAQ